MAAFAGLALAFLDIDSLPSPEGLIGDFLLLLAALAWTANTLVTKKSRLRSAPAEKILAYQLAVSAFVLLAISPIVGPSVRDLNGLVFGALASQVIAVVSISYLAWFWLLVRYPAALLSTFTFLVPVFGVIFAQLLLDEPISTRLILALGLIVAGIVAVSYRGKNGRGHGKSETAGGSAAVSAVR